MRKIVVAMAALSLLVPLGGAAVEVPAGSTSPGVRHIKHLPVGTGVGGTFVGKHYYLSAARSGFFLPGGAGTGGIIAFDATNPRNPIPVGMLPLPISQNEDVEAAPERNLLLVVQDRRKSVSPVATSPVIGGVLFVIDISNRSQPILKSVLQLPAEVATTSEGVPLGGPGHTASCIASCNYAWISGSRDRAVHVVDLRDAAAPALLGVIPTPAGADNTGYGSPGVVHDVHVDRFGDVWVVGSGGSAMYRLTADPLKPQLIASVGKADNDRLNGLIHHGALRYSEDLVLIGEEDYGDGACGQADEANQDGSLQIWRIDRAAKTLRPVSTWDAAIDNDVSQALADTVGLTCSSHWFDVNRHSVVADAWYEMGVRFLDIRNPAAIRQVGYFVGYNSAASQAKFHPGDSSVVYVADYNRGLDVIEIANGGHGLPAVSVPAAVLAAAHQGIRFGLAPDPEWGFACLRSIATA